MLSTHISFMSSFCSVVCIIVCIAQTIGYLQVLIILKIINRIPDTLKIPHKKEYTDSIFGVLLIIHKENTTKEHSPDGIFISRQFPP